MKPKFQLQPENGVHVVRFEGENLDGPACHVLRTEIDELLGSIRPVVLDASSIHFADSDGLAFLREMSCLTSAKFAVAGVGQRLGRCLDRLPANRRPRLFRTEAQAVHSLVGKSGNSPTPTLKDRSEVALNYEPARTCSS